MKTTSLMAALAAAGLASSALPASAVYVDPDGLGQALIFPYYTVQPSIGDTQNTYVSVVNHTRYVNAVRVRVREGRASKEVASFNLYLSPNDIWTGAIIPAGDGSGGTSWITSDRSCTSPAFAGSPATITFQNTAFSGANDDGDGTGLDRTREGFIEMIEMATLTGASAAGVSHNSAGVPNNCAVTQSIPSGDIAPPTGGLSGGLTLINVASGMDFTLNAVPLAQLSTAAFYRPATDPYPDFNAAEIDPTSTVIANGAVYRSTWSRPVDAVSAALMHGHAMGEFVLDRITQSGTDFVLTFPTRQFYVAPGAVRAPFSGTAGWATDCHMGQLGQEISGVYFNREEQGRELGVNGIVFSGLPGPNVNNFICATSVVFDMSNSGQTTPTPATTVLGSVNRGLGRQTVAISSLMENGNLDLTLGSGTLTSLATSTRTDLGTGVTTTGIQQFTGLPVVGFMARTFMNGTLACSEGTCQGNYGGAFPLAYTRNISP